MTRSANSKAVMARFECSQPTVSSWVKAGCPHTKEPREGGGRPQTLFDLDEVAQWVKKTRRNISPTGGGDHSSFAYRQGLESPDKTAVADLDIAQQRAKLRKDLAAAEKAELELDKLKGLLLDSAEVKMGQLARIARARAVLLGGPAVLAQETKGDPEHDETILAEWVHRSLLALAEEDDE